VLFVHSRKDAHSSDQKILEGKANGAFLCSLKQFLLLSIGADVLYLLCNVLSPSLFCGTVLQKTYCSNARRVFLGVYESYYTMKPISKVQFFLFLLVERLAV
jgi:hypothetical protein